MFAPLRQFALLYIKHLSLHQGKSYELEYEPVVRAILAGELEFEHKGEKLTIAKLAPDLSCAGVTIFRDIPYEHKLGEGGCAHIYYAKLNGQPMAMKELKLKPNAEFQKFRGTKELSTPGFIL